MMQLFTKAHWIKCRNSYLIAARECRQALTNPEGYWKLAQNDEQVTKAVNVWVEKARQAHGIVMNRRPVIANVVSINYGPVRTGSIYAE